MRNWKKRKPVAGSDAGEDDKPKTSAFDRALGLLSRREHSARELSRKLVDRGHTKDEAAAAVGAAAERSYQSDARFAESVIRRRAGAGYGRRYVESELKSHGIDPRQHREAIDEVDWPAAALDALRKRGLAMVDRDARHKASQYLARRGFDPVAIRHATATSAAIDPDDGIDD